MTKYHLIYSGGLKLKFLPLLRFKCSSNFRTFAQMLVAHLGNVWHREFSLQTSSSVKCFLITQFRCKIASRDSPKLDAYTHALRHLDSSDLNLNPK
jgi:hypothetical protein